MSEELKCIACKGSAPVYCGLCYNNHCDEFIEIIRKREKREIKKACKKHHGIIDWKSFWENVEKELKT